MFVGVSVWSKETVIVNWGGHSELFFDLQLQLQKCMYCNFVIVITN